jgi:hypothetical protein
MKKLFNNLSNIAFYGYAGFGVIVWVFNQFGVDVLSILANSSVGADFYGVTGFSVGLAKTGQMVIRTILTKYETRTNATYQTVLGVVKTVLDGLQTVEHNENINQDKLDMVIKYLNAVVKFDEILADKNLQSVILTDEQRTQIETFKNEISGLIK